MQKPGNKVDLAKTNADVRLTTGLDTASQQNYRIHGEATTQQEIKIPSQADTGTGTDQGFISDRLLDDSTDTHTGTSGSTHTDTQSDTRQKTSSGEISALDHHLDPNGTMGCNTCQEDLADAIEEHCRINVGDIVNSRYEIRTYLGEGGMSAVYAAFDKVIKRDVALKILHRDLLVRGKGSLLRFQREAQALGNLDHPNIVKIHHFDADENAQPYIVMDIVKGEPLARRLVKDPESFQFADIIAIFVQVCDALSHAHSRGVVHRDLKPSNIMVTDNHVKVLDFGIAKLMSEDSDQELQLTRTGEVFGSPLYMSPEQCRGLKLDFRSDIYSIGCVMFEAFTGNPPFTGNSHIDTMLKHVNELPPSVVGSMCDARYAEKVDAILLRCMAKNPNSRFQSMDEVKEALLNLDREIKSPFAKVKQKLELMRLKMGAQGKITPKMLGVCTAAGLLLTGLSGAAIYNSVTSAMSVKDSDVNIPRWKDIDVSAQKAFDKGDYKFADNSFKNGLEIARRLKHPGLRLASLDGLLDLQHAKMIMDPTLLNNKDELTKLAQYQKEVAGEKEAREKQAFALIDELKRTEPTSADAIDIGKQAVETAKEITSAGYPKLAEKLINSAMTLASSLGDPELLGACHFALGHAYYDAGNISAAREELRTALKIQEKFKEFDPNVARTLGLLAQTVDSKEAFPLLKRALKVQTTAFYPTSHQVGWVHNALAAQYLDHTQQYSSALREADQAVDILKKAVQRTEVGTERDKATDFLSKALWLRAQANMRLLDVDLLQSQQAKVPVRDLDARRAAISADINEALAISESINPKTSVNAVDDVVSRLLVEQGKNLKIQSEDFFSRGKMEEGKQALSDAKYRFVRALAISQRLPSQLANEKQANIYAWLGKVYRSQPDLKSAQAAYLKAKNFADKSYGSGSILSKSYQNEIDAIARDSQK